MAPTFGPGSNAIFSINNQEKYISINNQEKYISINNQEKYIIKLLQA
jgi:hypothetical protein